MIARAIVHGIGVELQQKCEIGEDDRNELKAQ